MTKEAGENGQLGALWSWRLAAILIALLVAGGVYAIVGRYSAVTQGPAPELVGIGFLVVLPMMLGAFATFGYDPLGTNPRNALRVPFALLLAVIVLSAVFLREGLICIIMLAPFWLGFGTLGGSLTYRMRRLFPDDRSYSVSLLLAPVIVVQAEPYLPIPHDRFSVTRSVTVAASPETLWPLIEGVGTVSPAEGVWTVSHNLIGLPRPRSARLEGSGPGATRWADWGHGILFREQVDIWQPGRAIGWRFAFDELKGWASTDRHLMPDGPYYRIERGAYRLEPLGGGKTRLTLTTEYSADTHFNAYAALWGQLFLGDIETNVLDIVRRRAEAHQSGQ